MGASPRSETQTMPDGDWFGKARGSNGARHSLDDRLSRRTDHRQGNRDTGAAAGPPADAEGAAERLRPFAHADQAETATHPVRLGRAQAAAVVLDDEVQHVVAGIEGDGAGR